MGERLARDIFSHGKFYTRTIFPRRESKRTRLSGRKICRGGGSNATTTYVDNLGKVSYGKSKLHGR